MKTKKSIGKIIFTAVIGVLLPVYFLMIGIFGNAYNSMWNMVVENQQSSLDLYVSQIESKMIQVQKYALAILSDKDYAGIRYSKGTTEYEVAKTVLYAKMSRFNGDGLWDGVDGNYIYVPHTDDVFGSRNTAVIDSKVNDAILEWMKTENTCIWTVTNISDTKYICANWGNGIYNIGIFVSEKTLSDQWENNQLGQLLVSANDCVPENFGDIVLAQEGLSGSLKFYCNIPQSLLKQRIPVIFIFLLMALVACVIVTIILYRILRKNVTVPLGQMKTVIDQIKGGDRSARISTGQTTSELEAIQMAFNEMMDEIYEMKIQAYELALENEKSKLMNLQLQINPHLLLNTLNTIYGLAEIREYENIQTFTQNLVSYFRYSLRDCGQPVPLRQELDFIKSFVEIQKIRYPDTFYLVYDIDDTLMELPVLPLIIENFVENSTKYAGRKGLVEILVIVRRNGDYLQVSICDDGKGMAPEVLLALKNGQPYERNGEAHVGIWNCERRLRLFYGDLANFSITSALGSGTQVWMEFPVSCKAYGRCQQDILAKDEMQQSGGNV